MPELPSQSTVGDPSRPVEMNYVDRRQLTFFTLKIHEFLMQVGLLNRRASSQ